MMALRQLRAMGSVLVVGLVLASVATAEDVRVYPQGQLPNDSRLGALKDLNGYFPFEVPETREAWFARRDELRRRVLVSTGLWPMPPKTPLKPVIHGLVERDGFTVEKVYFESLPDHFVTGLLFRPEGDSTTPRPGVLCPHGHGGRLQDYGADKIKGLIDAKAELFEKSGRYPKLARCAHLARMGCTVFIFDMLGYADSNQISYELAHRFAKQRADFDTPDSWGLYSTQAELRMQSIMGLQTWNSIRALDFLSELPDVDPQRLGVTGGSGGGTQTILLCAIDPRPVVAFPQGMVSTSMQGGCTCENTSLLRIGTGNVELTALFAPKPQAMTAANDWTKEMMTKGYPQLKQLYTLLGAPENVLCEAQLHFPHNYNAVTRAIMYEWFSEHLGLPQPGVERDYEPLTPAEYTVWNDQHPAPQGGPEYERKLTAYLDRTSQAQLSKLAPRDAGSWQRYREIVGGAVQTLIGRNLPAFDDIQRTKVGKDTGAGYLQFTDILRLTTHGEELPVISLFPKSTPWNGQVVIWVDGTSGKQGLFNADGRLHSAVRRLVDAGCAVLGADLLYQGEFLNPGQSLRQTPVVNNPREFAGYTHTYNHSLFARRVHDLLMLIAYVRGDDHEAQQVHLLGVGGAGPWVAAARAIAGKQVDRAAVDTRGFRFASLDSYRHPQFLPGAVKYGDVPALLALSAPHPLWYGGEARDLELVQQAYGAAGATDRLASGGSRQDTTDAAVDWLLQP